MFLTIIVINLMKIQKIINFFLFLGYFIGTCLWFLCIFGKYLLFFLEFFLFVINIFKSFFCNYVILCLIFLIFNANLILFHLFIEDALMIDYMMNFLCII